MIEELAYFGFIEPTDRSGTAATTSAADFAAPQQATGSTDTAAWFGGAPVAKMPPLHEAPANDPPPKALLPVQAPALATATGKALPPREVDVGATATGKPLPAKAPPLVPPRPSVPAPPLPANALPATVAQQLPLKAPPAKAYPATVAQQLPMKAPPAKVPPAKPMMPPDLARRAPAPLVRAPFPRPGPPPPAAPPPPAGPPPPAAAQPAAEPQPAQGPPDAAPRPRIDYGRPKFPAPPFPEDLVPLEVRLPPFPNIGILL